MTKHKQETTVSVTVHGLEEHIRIDGAHEVKAPKERRPNLDDPRLRSEADRQFVVAQEAAPVEYPDEVYMAVGRYFVENFRTLVDVHDHPELVHDRRQDEIAEAAKRDEARANA